MRASAWSGLSAVEAVRRLRSSEAGAGALAGLDATREPLRLRAAPHLGFAAGEVEDLREVDGRIELTLALPALYGPGSPLPSYVTERLLGQERESSRALIDLLNHRLLALTVLVAGRRELESGSARAARIAAYAGLGPRVERLRWAGLLRGRSASDLDAMLVDRCDPLPVRLEQQIALDTPLPIEARARLGQTCVRLGIDTTIGDHVATRATAFRVCLGPLTAAQACEVTNGPLPAAIVELVSECDADLLDWELVVLVEGRSVPPAALGTGKAELERSARLAGSPAETYRLVLRRIGSDKGPLHSGCNKGTV